MPAMQHHAMHRLEQAGAGAGAATGTIVLVLVLWLQLDEVAVAAET